MSGWQSLFIAYSIIIDCLKEDIISSNLDPDLMRIKLILKNNWTIYIIYNDYSEYSYVVLFSLEKFDRVRFDNYDNLWDVKTKPNHCHPRFKQPAKGSELSGYPKIDMKILCKMILDGSILNIK